MIGREPSPPRGVETREDGALWIDPRYEPVLRQGGLVGFDDFLRADGAELLRERGYSSNARLRIGDRLFYLKRHRFPRLGVAIRTGLKGRVVRLSGRLEMANFLRFQEAGFPSCAPAAAGDRAHGNTGEAFILTEALEGLESLEDVVPRRYAPPLEGPRRAELRRLIGRAGEHLRRLHDAGLNVRDLYLCHLFVDPDDPTAGFTLIDLHRALTGRKVGRPGVVRDLAALHHSAPDRIVSRTDRLRFLRAWSGARLDARLRGLVRRVERRAGRMERHESRQGMLWGLVHAGVPPVR